MPKVVFDESLFLDKIKEFNPESVQNDDVPAIIPEEDAIDEFDITQVEGVNNNDGNNVEIEEDLS